MGHPVCPSWVSEASLLSDVPMEDTLVGRHLNKKSVGCLKEHFLLFHCKTAQTSHSALEKLVSPLLAAPEMAEAEPA